MILKAILSINPNAQVSITDGVVEWLDGTTPIPQNEIDAKVLELKQKNIYIEGRRKEYPTIVDQLDDIYHNGIDGWKETIKAVKDKYPKE
jgi:hypothetical protein